MKTKVSKVQSLRLDVNEIVSYLKRTKLPTVLVEGADDKSIYRNIEGRFEGLGIDILVCGGRDALLNVYSRRSEFSTSKVIFVADKDMWYFTGIPKKYQEEIIFSNGYSLENDLYVKELFEGLLEDNEKRDFRKLISELARWFAYEVSRFKLEGHTFCDVHINRITDGNSLSQEYLIEIGFVEPDPSLVNKIINTYEESLRGKTLFQAILRFLSSSARKSKYSRYNLLEMGAKTNNACLDNMYKEIEGKLRDAQQDASPDCYSAGAP